MVSPLKSLARLALFCALAVSVCAQTKVAPRQIASSPVAGQTLTSEPSGTPTQFTSPGILLGNGGATISTTPYTAQCDSVSTLLDRARMAVLVNGASVFNVPASSSSGCGGGFVFELDDDGAGAVTVNRGGSDTFNILNSSNNSDAQTSFTFSNGQHATISNSGLSNGSGGTIWYVRTTTSSGAPAISALQPATASNTISIGNFQQTWNCLLTGSTPCFQLGEAVGSPSTGSGPIVSILTQASSLSKGLTVSGTNPSSVSSGVMTQPDLVQFTAATGQTCTTAACAGGGAQNITINLAQGGVPGAGGVGGSGSNLQINLAPPGVIGGGNGSFVAQLWSQVNLSAASGSSGVFDGSSGAGGGKGPGLTLINTQAATSSQNNETPSIHFKSNVWAGGTPASGLMELTISAGPYVPNANGHSFSNSANPVYSMLFANRCSSSFGGGGCSQNTNPNGYFIFGDNPGGVSIEYLNGGGILSGVGGALGIGDPSLQGGSINFQTALLGASAPNFIWFDHGGSGVADAAIEDDNKNNGTMVFENYFVNGSGATIADGSPVKISATDNQVTPTTTSDTVPLGVSIGSCASGATCHVAWGGRLVTTMVLGTGTCAPNQYVIIDTTTNARVKCTASPTVGQVIGMATSTQASVGSTVSVLLGKE
jgi:hypothetical protein